MKTCLYAFLPAISLALSGQAVLAQSVKVHNNRVSVTDGVNKVEVDTREGNHVRVTDGTNQVEVNTGEGNRVEVKAKAYGAKAKVNTKVSRRPPQEPLSIAGSDEQYDEDCAGRDVDITGSNLKVTLRGECGSVGVNGSDNTVNIDSVARIEVVGTSNQVTWRSGLSERRPQIANTGSDNVIKHRSR